MIPLATLAALAPVEDVRPFEIAAREGLTAFSGCHEISGTVEQEIGLGVFGKERETYTFTARLDGGAWTGLTATRTEDERPGSNMSFSDGSTAVSFVPPLLGKMPDAERVEGSLLAELLRALETEVETVTVTPTEDHTLYRMVRVLDAKRKVFGGTKENRAEVLFEPLSVRPRAWHVTTDIPLATGGGAHLRDIDIALELGADGLPARESLDAIGAWGPFVLHVQRGITYAVTGGC